MPLPRSNNILHPNPTPLAHPPKYAPFLAEQPFRRIVFSDLARIHDEDTVVADDGAQTVRDAEERSVGEFGLNGLLDDVVGVVID